MKEKLSGLIFLNLDTIHCEMFCVQCCRHRQDEQVLGQDCCHVGYCFSVDRVQVSVRFESKFPKIGLISLRDFSI